MQTKCDVPNRWVFVKQLVKSELFKATVLEAVQRRSTDVIVVDKERDFNFFRLRLRITMVHAISDLGYCLRYGLVLMTEN